MSAKYEVRPLNPMLKAFETGEPTKAAEVFVKSRQSSLWVNYGDGWQCLGVMEREARPVIPEMEPVVRDLAARGLELHGVSEAWNENKKLREKIEKARSVAQRNAGHRLMQVANPFREIVNILK